MGWFKKDPPSPPEPPRLESDPWEIHQTKLGLKHGFTWTYYLSECHRCRDESEAYSREFKRIFPLRFIKQHKNLKKRKEIHQEWGRWIDKLNEAKY